MPKMADAGYVLSELHVPVKQLPFWWIEMLPDNFLQVL